MVAVRLPVLAAAVLAGALATAPAQAISYSFTFTPTSITSQTGPAPSLSMAPWVAQFDVNPLPGQAPVQDIVTGIGGGALVTQSGSAITGFFTGIATPYDAYLTSYLVAYGTYTPSPGYITSVNSAYKIQTGPSRFVVTFQQTTNLPQPPQLFQPAGGSLFTLNLTASGSLLPATPSDVFPASAADTTRLADAMAAGSSEVVATWQLYVTKSFFEIGYPNGMNVSVFQIDGTATITGTGTSTGDSAIPEPGTAALLAVPLAAAGLRRRRSAA